MYNQRYAIRSYDEFNQSNICKILRDIDDLAASKEAQWFQSNDSNDEMVFNTYHKSDIVYMFRTTITYDNIEQQLIYVKDNEKAFAIYNDTDLQIIKIIGYCKIIINKDTEHINIELPDVKLTLNVGRRYSFALEMEMPGFSTFYVNNHQNVDAVNYFFKNNAGLIFKIQPTTPLDINRILEAYRKILDFNDLGNDDLRSKFIEMIKSIELNGRQILIDATTQVN
jgi:hypothetical protein